MFSLTPLVANISQSQPLWLIDTRATHLVCCSSSAFSSLTKLVNAFVTLPNGQQVFISSVGSVQLTPSLSLNSILFVPNFSYNLLYISSLTTSNNCHVTFTHVKCLIQDASKKMLIGKDRRIGNLN